MWKDYLEVETNVSSAAKELFLLPEVNAERDYKFDK